MKKEYLYLTIAFLVGVLLAVLIIPQRGLPLGGSSPGLNPSVASTTSFSLATPGVVRQITSTTTTCASRIVTTDNGGGIGLNFNDQPLRDGFYGHWQAASTTVIYDGELYGCGVMRARSVASSTVTVTETQ